MSDVLLRNAVITVTGARGVGKSWFITMYTLPEDLSYVFYHDSERSGNKTVQDLESQGVAFGYYGDLESRFSLPSDEDLMSRLSRGELPWMDSGQKNAMEQYYQHILEDIDKNLTKGNFKVYALDTLEKFESGMVAHVENHIKDFGFSSIREANRYAKKWNACVYPLYEQLIAAIFARGVETILLGSHLKNVWMDGKPVVGKVAPSGKPLLYRLSSLMIWLVNDFDNISRAPAGLVLKERTGKLKVVEGRWKPQSFLPPRIPLCNWWGQGEEKDSIEWYLKNGADFGNLTDKEQMTESERQMISELLSDEQMKLMILDAEKELEAMKQQETPILVGRSVANPLVDEIVGRIVDLGRGREKAELQGLLLEEGYAIPLIFTAFDKVGI